MTNLFLNKKYSCLPCFKNFLLKPSIYKYAAYRQTAAISQLLYSRCFDETQLCAQFTHNIKNSKRGCSSAASFA